ncbi:MAG: MgtC/SapB family protein [Candidatus Sumerlaeia bacterium]
MPPPLLFLYAPEEHFSGGAFRHRCFGSLCFRKAFPFNTRKDGFAAMIQVILDLNWQQMGSILLHLFLAYVFALPIGIDRERGAKSAGLRTFPLVAVGSCAFMLIGVHVFNDQQAQSRIIYGIVTGIGFIGGGAILKKDDAGIIAGTATAASIWNTGAIGIAVAWNLMEIALMLSLLNFLTFYFLSPVEEKMDSGEKDSDQKEMEEK